MFLYFMIKFINYFYDWKFLQWNILINFQNDEMKIFLNLMRELKMKL